MPDSAERWLPVPGFEGAYQVSDHGSVRSLDRWVTAKPGYAPYLSLGRPLSPYDNRGHWMVNLYRAGQGKRGMWRVFVHHLVLHAFVGPRPAGMLTRHLNGDGHDNRLPNIVYGTTRENEDDSLRHGAKPRGESHGMAILDEEAVHFIRREMAKGKRGTGSDLAQIFGVDKGVPVAVADGRIWSHVPWLDGEAKGQRWRPSIDPWRNRRRGPRAAA